MCSRPHRCDVAEFGRHSGGGNDRGHPQRALHEPRLQRDSQQLCALESCTQFGKIAQVKPHGFDSSVPRGYEGIALDEF